MMPKSARFIFVTLFSVFLLSQNPSEALEVKEARWGFNDGVRVGHFNPVFALLYNDSKTENFDGEISLRPGLFGPVQGVVEKKRVFLAPKTSRWIQFAPMISSTNEDWKIQWGSGPRDWFPMPDLVGADNCWLILYTKENELTQVSGFRSRLDSFWPEHVALTHGINAVFLDHEPDWNADQEKAFVDWLYLGGKVHILLGRDSLHPKFFRRMKILNGKKRMERWGAGYIVRQPFHEFQLKVKMVAKAPVPFSPAKLYFQNREEVNGHLIEQMEAARPKPKHRWNLIFLLCFVYLIIIGPINFVVARKAKSYRPGLVFSLVIISVFTLTFYFLGRRGYKESALHYKIEFARSLGKGQFDVQSWNHLFVTDSGEYRLKQNASSGFYGPIENAVSMEGFVENGEGGQFTTKIPLFSTRSYLARHRMSTKPLFGAIIERDHSKDLKFEIKKGPGFPKKASFWLLYNKQVYTMTDTGESLKVRHKVGGISQMFGLEVLYNGRYWNGRYSTEIQGWQQTKKLSKMALHEVAERLEDPSISQDLDIHLIVRSKSPDEWSVIDWPTPHQSLTYFQFTFPHEKR